MVVLVSRCPVPALDCSGVHPVRYPVRTPAAAFMGRVLVVDRSAWPCPDGCVQAFFLGQQLGALNQLARIVSGSVRGCLHFVLLLRGHCHLDGVVAGCVVWGMIFVGVPSMRNHPVLDVLVLVPVLVGWATGCLFCGGAVCAGTACVASIPTVVSRCVWSPAGCSLPGGGTGMSSVVVEGLSGWFIGAHLAEISSGM